VLEDLRKISIIDPLATDYALYEMLRSIFRGDAEARSEISREVAHSVPVLGLARSFGRILVTTPHTQLLAEPGAAVFRCCSASMPAGVTLAIAVCSLFCHPLTTSPSPFIIAWSLSWPHRPIVFLRLADLRALLGKFVADTGEAPVTTASPLLV
jgi:hypothetical protein